MQSLAFLLEEKEYAHGKKEKKGPGGRRDAIEKEVSRGRNRISLDPL